jgi:hypothetical protein
MIAGNYNLVKVKQKGPIVNRGTFKAAAMAWEGEHNKSKWARILRLVHTTTAFLPAAGEYEFTFQVQWESV